VGQLIFDTRYMIDMIDADQVEFRHVLCTK
jgi:hypothetical protein